jgi:hypothetical protein
MNAVLRLYTPLQVFFRWQLSLLMVFSPQSHKAHQANTENSYVNFFVTLRALCASVVKNEEKKVYKNGLRTDALMRCAK